MLSGLAMSNIFLMPDIDDIQSKIGKNTTAIVINNPCCGRRSGPK